MKDKRPEHFLQHQLHENDDFSCRLSPCYLLQRRCIDQAPPETVVSIFNTLLYCILALCSIYCSLFRLVEVAYYDLSIKTLFISSINFMVKLNKLSSF